MALSLGELAVRFGCELRGDPDLRVEQVAPLERAGPQTISFLANARFRRFLAGTHATAVILAPDLADECPVAALISDNPYALYARIAARLHPQPVPEPGVHRSAVIADDAAIPASAHIGAGAVIGAGTRVAERVFVGPGCVIGQRCAIGDDARLVASVTLCDGVILGARGICHPGVVIGADGFGIARDGEAWIKVPQLGSVRIGDDVEIGANTTIDRGALEDTVIEDGVKLDNQIQVAHNVRIGAHTVIAGCTGIAGSTLIGRRCMIGGQVGFVGHLSIADDVVITGRSMVTGSIDRPGTYSGGLPLDEAVRWRRNSARFRQLDEMARRLAQLEKQSSKAGRKHE
ncbi:MAG TPA: UDP-3-O-(3-hydroxymyristoyl)glucosamine N-acyltransferase [Gammaproteobacteria bacterium]|nr:UDP-3-O-(3-hydroxymyristoyl)glucosamine N-acyltransferase [Gammaproteobacteria bacterium]